jgi:hypothetical protein
MSRAGDFVQTIQSLPASRMAAHFFLFFFVKHYIAYQAPYRPMPVGHQQSFTYSRLGA